MTLEQIKFAEKHVGPIRRREKTETRRPHEVRHRGIGIGCHYDAVTPDGTRFAELKVVGLYLQKVCDFTDEDAKREGYETHDQLWEALMEHYDELPLQQEMTVIRFEVCDDSEEA